MWGKLGNGIGSCLAKNRKWHQKLVQLGFSSCWLLADFITAAHGWMANAPILLAHCLGSNSATLKLWWAIPSSMGSVWYTSFYGCRPWAVGPTLFYSERRGEGKGGGGCSWQILRRILLSLPFRTLRYTPSSTACLYRFIEQDKYCCIPEGGWPWQVISSSPSSQTSHGYKLIV